MNNIINFIGLARRAGCAVFGARLCEKSIKERRAKLVIVAENASGQTKKSIYDCCAYYKSDVISAFNKKEIGKIAAVEECSVISITDKGFAEKIKSEIINKINNLQ